MRRFVLSVLLMFMPLTIYAGVDPIADALLAAMKWMEFEQLPHLAESLAQLRALYSLTNDLKTDMKSYLSGNFKFDIKDEEMRQYKWEGSDTSWESVLSASSGGEEFQSAKNKYNQIYATDAPEKLSNVSSLTKNQYEQSRQINTAALAASSVSYTLIAQHTQKVRELLSRLDHEKDEKVTTDLNARLVSEFCFITDFHRPVNRHN